MDGVRGLGRAIFAAALLMIGSVLNIIYGIAAIGNSKFFIHDTKYVFADLKTWGWITLILGIMEGIAAAGESLLVVTETIGSELLRTLVVNALKATLSVCVVRPARDRFGSAVTPGMDSLGRSCASPPCPVSPVETNRLPSGANSSRPPSWTKPFGMPVSTC